MDNNRPLQDEFDVPIFDVEADGVHVPSNTIFEKDVTFEGEVYGLPPIPSLTANAIATALGYIPASTDGDTFHGNVDVEGELSAQTVVSDSAAIGNVTSSSIHSNTANIVSVSSNTISSNVANILTISSNTVSANSLNVTTANIGNVTSVNITTNSVVSNTANLMTVNANTVISSNVSTNVLNANTINLSTANISGNVSVVDIAARNITANNLTSTSGTVYLSADKSVSVSYANGAYALTGNTMSIGNSSVWTTGNFDPNTKANTSGTAFTGGISAPSVNFGDANAYLIVSNTNVFINFDTNDYIGYDRTNNVMTLSVANNAAVTIANTITVNASVTIANNVNVPSINGYTVPSGNSTGTTWSRIPTINTDGGMEVGQYIDFHANSAAAVDNNGRLGANANSMLSWTGSATFNGGITLSASGPGITFNNANGAVTDSYLNFFRSGIRTFTVGDSISNDCLYVNRYDANGAYVATPFQIKRNGIAVFDSSGVTFQGSTTIQGSMSYQYYNTTAGTDMKYWRHWAGTNEWLLEGVNDAYTAASIIMRISRNGTAASAMRINTSLTVGSDVPPTRTLDVRNGGIVVSDINAGMGQYDFVGGVRNATWRNDGANIYLLFSDAQANADAARSAGFNGYRPFTMSFSTGAISIGHGLTVAAGLTSSNDMVVGGTTTHNGLTRCLYNNGGRRSLDVGDDASLGDANLGHTISVTSQSDGNQGFFCFGQSTQLLGMSSNNNYLRWGGDFITGSWFRLASSGGLYWEAYGRGLNIPDTQGSSYGNVNTYGSGMNGWGGYMVGANDMCFMSNFSSQRGIYSPNYGGWLVSYDNSGNATFPQNVTAYSDERLKHNIRVIYDAWDIVKGLTGIRYERDGQTRVGLGAQTTRKVLPEVVHEADDLTGTLSVNYGDVIGPVVEALKQAMKRIEDLEAEVKLLKGN